MNDAVRNTHVLIFCEAMLSVLLGMYVGVKFWGPERTLLFILHTFIFLDFILLIMIQHIIRYVHKNKIYLYHAQKFYSDIK